MAAEQKLAIKIAGELDSSFQSSIAGAKQGIASITGGGSGKLGSAFSSLGAMAAAAGKVIAGTYGIRCRNGRASEGNCRLSGL